MTISDFDSIQAEDAILPSSDALEALLDELGAIRLEPLLETPEVGLAVLSAPSLGSSGTEHIKLTCQLLESVQLAPDDELEETVLIPPSGHATFSAALDEVLYKRLPHSPALPSYGHRLVNGQPDVNSEAIFPVSNNFIIIFRLVLDDPQQLDNALANKVPLEVAKCTNLSLAKYQSSLRIGRCEFLVDTFDPTVFPDQAGDPTVGREQCAYLAYTTLAYMDSDELEGIVKGDCVSNLRPQLEEQPLKVVIAMVQTLKQVAEFTIKQSGRSFTSIMHLHEKEIDGIIAFSRASHLRIIDALNDCALQMYNQIASGTVSGKEPAHSVDSSNHTTCYSSTAQQYGSSDATSFSNGVDNSDSLSYSQILEERCSDLDYAPPVYSLTRTTNGMYSCSIKLYFVGSPRVAVYVDTGSTVYFYPEEAKERCAMLALKQVPI
ncbi:hypothetical protein BDF19DRAFT_447601 [Syncephalis fuscata]|nr:hypothetical protein BDF19DRAFT_447601 [Syncephalis fuscata]